MQREAKRRKTLRRGVIVLIAAVLVLGSAVLLFSSKSPSTTATTLVSSASTSTSTTVASSTTTTSSKPVTTVPVASPSPAGTFGHAPSVVVPAGAPPTTFQVTDLIKGTGRVAQSAEKLTVQYVLATYSTRKVIQSSWTAQPYSFTVGAGTVIPGWDKGLIGMQVGGRRELILPPALGYGATARGGGIGANDTLVFVIDLLKIG